MDDFFSNLPDIVGSLSTSGAQWYKLVSTPNAVSVPAFGPTSAGAVRAQTTASIVNNSSGLLLIGALVIGAVLILRK